MLAGAVGLGAAAFFDPLLVASPLFDKALFALVAGGISSEAGAIADALSSNRGSNLTIRQPAAYRQIVYGQQRVGGVLIYASTTGSHHDQYNHIFVLAGHTIDSYVNLYLDGRRVYWAVGSQGNISRNGINFGGYADPNTHKDEGNNKYSFGSFVYCEARFGDQAQGDVISALTANDPNWIAGPSGSPYVGGCAYLYLKTEYDANQFPSPPEIRVTLNGKNNIWDPRTNTYGYTANWALCVADVLLNPEYGLGESQSAINVPQLIAAANICDEQVPLAAGGTEARYTLNGTFNTSQGPGDMLQKMMSAAAGRISNVGGQWFIFPGAYVGPSLSYDMSSVIEDAPIVWNSHRSAAQLYNRVKGTYIAPNFPYAVAGNVYDGNGFWDGTRQNEFDYEWQRTDYPQYACDPGHGYAADAYLAQDGNVPLYYDLNLDCTISVATAQRLAKIELMRNRFQGSGSFTLNLSGLRLQPNDVFTMTFAPFGWANKIMEVTNLQFATVYGEGPPRPAVQVSFQETDPSIYAWSPREEQTPTGQPASLTMFSYQTEVPGGPIGLIDNASTAIAGPDGVVRPRIQVSWVQPADAFVTQIQIQVQAAGSSGWSDAGMADYGNTIAYVGDVVAGASYSIRIRSLTAKGAPSAWITVGPYTVSNTFSQINSSGVAPGLIYNAPNTATIDSIVNGSTATVRVYGPGGDGTAYTQILGGQTLTLPGAHLTGQSFATTYVVQWSTVTSSYLISPAGSSSDSLIYIGSVTTVASSGTGGSGGGGGRGSGCTVRGTLLITPEGAVSNELLKARFDTGATVYLQGRRGPERLVRAQWVTFDEYQEIRVDGYTTFCCSVTHTLLAEDTGEHRHCAKIPCGTRVDTLTGYETMRRRTIHDTVEVLKIEISGPSHEYLVEDGVWTHNIVKGP